MASVLNDPSSRLYAGALLGKALVKELGEAGRTSDSEDTLRRRATLTAGVASGKIRPGQLSGADLSLLGGALSKPKVHIPSLLSNPLGFAGGFVKNLGEGAGEFAESLQGLPQGILHLGEAGASELKRAVTPPGLRSKQAPLAETLKQLGRSVASDFSSPQQIYEHPFNPLLDVGAVASGGLGALGKGAEALSRAGKFGNQADIAASAGLGPKLIRMRSPEGRAPAIGSPGFTRANEEALASAGVQGSRIPRKYALSRPIMKYVVQKPLDTAISKLQDVNVPRLGQTFGDLQGRYYGSKAINESRAGISAGTTEAMHNSPFQGYLHAAGRMFAHGPGPGQYMYDAMILRKIGIVDLDTLDEYINLLKSGEDREIEGPVMTPDLKRAQADRIKMYEDPRFRQLIDEPRGIMNEVSHQLDRLNVHYGPKLYIDPTTSEDAMFGRLRGLTGGTNEDVINRLPPELRPNNAFAKGLQGLEEVLTKEGEAMLPVPSVEELAARIPYGSQAQRVSIIQRAVDSLKEDQAPTRSRMELKRDPTYLPGETIFDKVANALHDELGLDEEHATAFTRGINLGTPEGPIQLGYIPSVSGEGLKWEARRETILNRIGRNVGVSKFQPLAPEGLEGIPSQSSFVDFPRPFTPRTASAQTIGLGPAMNYTKDATYGSFLKGVADYGPEAIAKNAYQIERDILTKYFNPPTIDKLAIKSGDKAKIYLGKRQLVEDLGTNAKLYTLVPVNAIKNFFKAKSELEFDAAKMGGEGESAGFEERDFEALADEHAHEFVDGISEEAAKSFTQSVALPNTFVKQMIEHARVSEQGTSIGRALSYMTSRWKTAVLSYMPAWLLRTTLGHGLIAVIDGMIDPRYWVQAHRYDADRPVLKEHTDSLGPWSKAGDVRLRAEPQYQPEALPPGVNQGGLSNEVADVGSGSAGKQLLPARAIQGGVHTATNYQRRAIALRSLDRAAKQRFAELGRDFDHPGGFWNSKNIDAVLDPDFRAEVLQKPDLIEHMKDQLNHVSYTFGAMSPWERKLVKYGMPFWGWYKFITKFAWGLPFNYPGRAAMLGTLGKLGIEDHTKLGPLPNYLQGALFFNTHNLAHAQYVNLYGLNPLADYATPFGHEGALMSLIRLGQFSPAIQAGLAGFGINPVTGGGMGVSPSEGVETGRYGELINLQTGQELPSAGVINAPRRILGTFLRAFPEVRAGELLRTAGNPVYPESIPLLDEKPIAVSPESRHGYDPLQLLAGEVGVQPRVYNFPKKNAQFLKRWREAQHKNRKTLQKAAQRMSEPTP